MDYEFHNEYTMLAGCYHTMGLPHKAQEMMRDEKKDIVKWSKDVLAIAKAGNCYDVLEILYFLGLTYA